VDVTQRQNNEDVGRGSFFLKAQESSGDESSQGKCAIWLFVCVCGGVMPDG
jgi:hypothetical protein